MQNRYGMALVMPYRKFPPRTPLVCEEPVTTMSTNTRRINQREAHYVLRSKSRRFVRRIAINVRGRLRSRDERRDYGSGPGGRQTGMGDVGIRDGFEGLLHPDRYPDGGLVTLNPQADREPGSGGLGYPRPIAPGRSVSRPHGR